MAHGGRHRAVLLEPVFGRSHQVRCVGAVVPVSEGQVGEDLPGVLHRNFRQNERIGHARIRIPVAGETAVIIAVFHLAQHLFLPVHIVILSFFLALANQFIQNRLSVLEGGGEHLLPVLRYGFEVKFIEVSIVFRVGVHHQTLQQRFVIRLDEHGHKALMGGVPSGITVRCHDGVIVLHGWEVSAFAVQVFHNSLSHLGRLQRVLVKVLSLPVGKALFDHLCHGLIVVLVKGDEQVGFVLDLVGVVALLSNDADGVVVDVAGEEWTFLTIGICTIVVGSKGSADFVEHWADQLTVQLIPDKCPQIHAGGVSLDLLHHIAVFL